MAHDLGRPAQGPLHPAGAFVFSGVSGVHPHVRETLGESASHRFEQELDTVAVLDVCAVNLGFEHQTLGVHEQMAL